MINARIYDGDIVYIREQAQVENGEIAVCLVEGEFETKATLKRHLSDFINMMIRLYCNQTIQNISLLFT